MAPSYGQPGRCIIFNGIDTVDHDREIVPCPYMDLYMGNVVKEPLAAILGRGIKSSWLGPRRGECIIGERQGFISFHNQAFSDYLDISPPLPVPFEHGFGRSGSIKAQ
jgi:hypothetical protein